MAEHRDEDLGQFETSTQLDPPSANSRPLTASSGGATGSDGSTLDIISQRVLWLATAMIDAANRGRQNPDGVKVGGHQASSASMVGIMTALWFSELTPLDRVSVKPHASPVLHAINYLLGDLDESYLPRLRALGGLQPYPSRSKDPDTVDFSTGSVGIGATAPIWAALSHRYLTDRFPNTPPAGRFISLLGDAEMDEGAVWEAIIDPEVRQLGEVVWIVDLNRQSLDRVIPDVQIQRLRGMFAAADWQVLTCTWGHRLQAAFGRPGGQVFEARMRKMPNEEYQRTLRAHPEEVRARLLAGVTPAEHAVLEPLLKEFSDLDLAELVRDLGGHDLKELQATFKKIDNTRPTAIFAYTIKAAACRSRGTPATTPHSSRWSRCRSLRLRRACRSTIPGSDSQTARTRHECAPKQQPALAETQSSARRLRQFPPSSSGGTRPSPRRRRPSDTFSRTCAARPPRSPSGWSPRAPMSPARQTWAAGSTRAASGHSPAAPIGSLTTPNAC